VHEKVKQQHNKSAKKKGKTKANNKSRRSTENKVQYPFKAFIATQKGSNKKVAIKISKKSTGMSSSL